MGIPLDGSIEGDKWAKKIKLVLSLAVVEGKTVEGYIIEGAPPWWYTSRSGNPSVDEIVTSYHESEDKTKYWYGVCRHHAYVWANILQERIEGQWHMIGGVSIKAMYVRKGEPLWHAWLEICVNGKGYYTMHVNNQNTHEFYPRELEPFTPTHMGNRWNQCEWNKYEYGNLVKYNPDWAGQVEIPEKRTTIEFKSLPQGAEIWLKKH